MKNYTIILALVLLLGCGAEQAVETPTEKPVKRPPQGCDMMINEETQELNCFGCAGMICTDPAKGWVLEDSEEAMKAGFACTRTADGCQLIRMK